MLEEEVTEALRDFLELVVPRVIEKGRNEMLGVGRRANGELKVLPTLVEELGLGWMSRFGSRQSEKNLMRRSIPDRVGNNPLEW